MFKIALTGSTLSGKKTVANMFKSMNIPVFDADVAMKFLIHFDSSIIRKIKNEFGSNAYEVGFLNERFFRDDDQIRKLLSFTKTDIQEIYHKFHTRHMQSNAPYTIFKSSCFFEMDLNNWKETRLEIGNSDKAKFTFGGISFGDKPSMKEEAVFFFDAVINAYTPIDIRKYRNLQLEKSFKKTYNFDRELNPATKKAASTFSIDSFADKNLLEQVEKIHYTIINKNKKSDVTN